jgi:benzoyl-CoA 2,3-dioxygenase component B
MEVVEDGKLLAKDIPLRTAMNEVLRDAYVEDCQRAVDKWNNTIRESGLSFELRLPSRRFHRRQGIYAGHPFDPEGNLISQAAYDAKKDEWLPSAADRAYVRSLMHGVFERGKLAHWIAPPKKGINRQPFDFEYVRRPAD